MKPQSRKMELFDIWATCILFVALFAGCVVAAPYVPGATKAFDGAAQLVSAIDATRPYIALFFGKAE